MRFGQLGEFDGGGLQVARIEGQVGLVMQFFVLAVVFSVCRIVLYSYRCRTVFSDGQYGGQVFFQGDLAVGVGQAGAVK